MTKVIYMDASLSEVEMEAQIEIEADNLIPYSLDEVSIDFETLSVNKTDPSKVDVLLSACRTENIDARIDALDSVDLEPKVVDVEGYALGRAHELILGQLPDGAADQVVALVDIGANMTTFAVVEKGKQPLSASKHLVVNSSLNLYCLFTVCPMSRRKRPR